MCAALAALLATGLAACVDDSGSSSSGQSADGRVTLRIGDQNKTLELPLTLSGENAGTPYGLQWNNFADGPNMNAAFSAGKLDVGFMGDTPTLFAAAADAGVVAVAVQETPVNPLTIFAAADSGIRTPADLAGKRIALTVGTALHGYLLRQLDSAGLTQDDITLVNVPVSTLVSTFSSGQVDAIVYTKQYAHVLLDQAPGAYEIDVTPVPYFSVILAAKKALEDPDRRSAVEDFVLRMSRASTWPKENPDEWVQKYYVELLKQDPVLSREYFDSLPETRYTPVNKAFLESQQAQADLLIGVGELPASLNVDDLVDPEFNTALEQRFAAAGLAA